MSLAKCLRLLTLCNTYCITLPIASCKVLCTVQVIKTEMITIYMKRRYRKGIYKTNANSKINIPISVNIKQKIRNTFLKNLNV